MRKVLFIAYHFPPIGGSGVQRPGKFVKYLSLYGWQPYVVSTDEDPEQGVDCTLLKDIPGDVNVWRVPTPRPKPVNRLAHAVGWKPATPQMDETSSSPSVQSPPQFSLALWVKRLRRAILAPLYLIQNPPVDQNLFWSLRVVPLARQIIKQGDIDVILTTSPPWSPLLTGFLLKLLTGKPWVADFRDPWTDNTFIYFPTAIQRWFDAHLERFLVRRANALVAVTPPLVQGLTERVAGSKKKPPVLIPNGWDEDDLVSDADVQAGGTLEQNTDGKIILLHPGNAYQGEPLPILKALEQLPGASSSLETRLQFRFVGYMHPADTAQIHTSAYDALFNITLERVPHPEALHLMRKAHVLLLLLRKGANAYSGKVFEYMVIGKPVLAITSGIAADLVHQVGIGCAISPENQEELASALHQIAFDYEGFVDKYYHPNWELIRQYNRKILTERLASVLDAVGEH